MGFDVLSYAIGLQAGKGNGGGSSGGGGALEPGAYFYRPDIKVKNYYQQWAEYNGEIYSWQTSNIYLVGYIMYGIPVSHDGRFVFAQQDMKGMLCLDAKDGHVVWKTQSRAEYSHVLVGDTHLCCSKSRNEIQLINIENGSVIQTYRTPFDNRFEVLTDDIILNHTRSKSWEVLSSKTLDVLQTIPDAFLWQNKRSIEQFYKSKT